MHTNGSEDHSSRGRACKTLLLKRTDKVSYFGYRNAWTMFSNQTDK
jgi:hypothetical protein